MRVLMIVQEPVVTRRVLQEAHSLTAAGHEVRLLTRAEGSEDSQGSIEGIPTRWVAVRGRDPRFRWLYRLAGVRRGSDLAALWGVLTMRHTFTLRALPVAIRERADVYHAHDLINLTLAYRAARASDARLVYDSHELFPDIDNRWIRLRRRAWMRRESHLMPRADLSITVNELIAEELSRRNKVPPPLVLLNCPDVPPGFDADQRYNLIRERLGLDAGTKIVLYHGWIAEGRGLENLVLAAPLLAGDAAVVLLGNGEQRAALERLASEKAPGRVHFLPAVAHTELLPYCASADVGMVPIQDRGLNYRYTSPNRLYDFIQAAVPIVANDLPYLRKVVEGDGLGVVARLDSPESYAQAINSVLTRPDGGAELRANLLAAAPGYTWATQARKLVDAYSRL